MNYPVKEPVNYKFSHVFSQVFHRFFTGCEILKTCEQGTFHRVKTCEKTYEKTCEIQPVKKPMKKPVKKNSVWGAFSQVVFTGSEISKTCEHGTFHRVKTCEKIGPQCVRVGA